VAPSPRALAPKPPQTPNPDPGRMVPTQRGGTRLAQHPWVLPVEGDLQGRRSCPGRGSGRSAGSPPGSRPAPGRRGRAAAGPRAQPSWRHRQRLRRGRDKNPSSWDSPGTAEPYTCTELCPVSARPPSPPSQTRMFPVSLPKLSFRERSPAASSPLKQTRCVPV